MTQKPILNIPQQFSHIRHYWDAGRSIYVAKILPGEFYVTRQHELISTLLGSCVAVCMRDSVNKIGGMNHFKLPLPLQIQGAAIDTNYGMYAMEMLINEILKAGGDKKYLECHVFGGGNVIDGLSRDIGTRNLEFVSSFLKNEKIPILSRDVAHDSAQNVFYHVITGKAFSVVSGDGTADDVRKAEKEYLAKVEQEMNKSGIIYF